MDNIKKQDIKRTTYSAEQLKVLADLIKVRVCGKAHQAVSDPTQLPKLEQALSSITDKTLQEFITTHQLKQNS